MGVYAKETRMEKDDYAPTARRIANNMVKHVGVFANAIAQKAFLTGANGKEPPLNRLAKIQEGTSINGTDLAGKRRRYSFLQTRKNTRHHVTAD